MNAFQHGLAGQGDLPGPGEDLEQINHRAAVFARDLGAADGVGLILAHRAALLSLRMERAALQELVAIALNTEQAEAAFDAELAERVDEWVAQLDSDDPYPALGSLQTLPSGVARLIAAWTDVGRQLRATDAATGAAAATLARRWLGLDPADPTPPDPAVLARWSDAEVIRLGQLAGQLDDVAEGLAQARRQQGILASFDPGPDATKARRYEAAAERGMYRALHAITDLNHRAEPAEPALAPPPVPTSLPLAVVPPPVVAPPPPTLPPAPEELASFRAEVIPPAPPLHLSAPWDLDPEPTLIEPRKPRPDLRKLDRKRRKNRR